MKDERLLYNSDPIETKPQKFTDSTVNNGEMMLFTTPERWIKSDTVVNLEDMR